MESEIIQLPLYDAVHISRRLFLITLLSILLLSGCATKSKPLYYWGEYENLVYAMYVAPGEADTQSQVTKLNEDIQRAHDNGQRVPPGIHAHLGYMYAILGNTGASLGELETEKQLYPESSVFIDRIIKKLAK